MKINYNNKIEYSSKKVDQLSITTTNKDTIQNKAEVSSGNKEKVNPLYIAVQKGHLEIANELLKKLGDKPITILGMAARQGNIEVFKYLLEQEEAELLSIAIQNGHSKIAEFLLEKNPNLLELVEVQKQEEIRYKLKYNSACLINTKEERYLDEVIRLIEDNKSLPDLKENINTRYDLGMTLLSYTACCKDNHKSVKLAELLIKREADIHIKDIFGLTPLHYAAISNNTEIAKLIIKADKKAIYDKDNKGYTPTHYAIMSKMNDVSKLISDMDLNFSPFSNQREQIANPSNSVCDKKNEIKGKKNFADKFKKSDSHEGLVNTSKENSSLSMDK